jgi:hypothetical protein
MYEERTKLPILNIFLKVTTTTVLLQSAASRFTAFANVKA